MTDLTYCVSWSNQIGHILIVNHFLCNQHPQFVMNKSSVVFNSTVKLALIDFKQKTNINLT